MRIIAFITEPSTVRRILNHRGEPTRQPHCAPARAPLLWEAATASAQAENDPHGDPSVQPLPQIEFDLRLAR